jgi:hypothetical protein
LIFTPLLTKKGITQIGKEDKHLLIRFATFNVEDLRTKATQDKNGSDPHVKAVAEIIQRVNPDVLSLNEIAFDIPRVEGASSRGANARAFVENYLKVPQKQELSGSEYSYLYFEQGNTGIPSGMDLDNDGKQDGPGDAFGYGYFEGQYSMALLSKFPIDKANLRAFQKFLWKDMPNNLIPSGFYSAEELEVLRLSSKSHWDVPINIRGTIVHVLMAHPTPPSFDGPEDRNGRRNHDEIKLLADYISNRSYLIDDNGIKGGLPPRSNFVVMGDMNADPRDGESIPGAIQQLIEHPLIKLETSPKSQGGIDHADPNHLNPPEYDTAGWGYPPGNLQVDYVLPSKELTVVNSGVFWPSNSDQLSVLIEKASDHRLVWVDVKIPVKT